MQRVNIFTPIISTGFLGQFFGVKGVSQHISTAAFIGFLDSLYSRLASNELMKYESACSRDEREPHLEIIGCHKLDLSCFSDQNFPSD